MGIVFGPGLPGYGKACGTLCKSGMIEVHLYDATNVLPSKPSQPGTPLTEMETVVTTKPPG
jgi:hypothetical protein